ncbi:McrC family protein [Colwellia sp. 4_MG-2023]|uniref:McrC family protein n=1 Tax=unclassified Colwellia TaxID=196834 RepID=UPI0026E477AF|nr:MULTISPECIES: McrC family protein [unclassified Colwellia]MDO6505544.1 McrC family protein [Colwellia sp. 5_MG-2023]MDO6554160.1 McrC family protein [Colwellia sp. 4_MG-2023]
MATWTVYEYARLFRDNHTAIVGDNLCLSDNQFDALKKLIKSDDSDHYQLFRYGFEKRREVLVCQNYVGVICLPDGDQIEILPKTHKLNYVSEGASSVDKDKSRNNLIKMLKATRYLPGKMASSAALDITNMPLLDVFIQLFLDEVNSLIKRGISRHYQPKEENIAYLKGKLLVSQQIRTNLVMKHRHYMEFDELSSNRAENRLIRSALQWAFNRVEGKTKHFCQELLFHFTDIPTSKNIRLDLKSWQKGRHLRHYEPVLPWLEMIFKEQSPTSVDGSTNMLSILFPMEKVFEDYVALALKKQFPEYDIKTQVREKSLITHTPIKGSKPIKEKSLFQLRPDLYITCTAEDRVIIGDTKWKLIDENLPGKKYNIKESDIYQMLAYNQTYQKNEEKGAEIWLIYPKSENFTQGIPDFKFDNGSVIKVRPFDIDRSLLILDS